MGQDADLPPEAPLDRFPDDRSATGRFEYGVWPDGRACHGAGMDGPASPVTRRRLTGVQSAGGSSASGHSP